MWAEVSMERRVRHSLKLMSRAGNRRRQRRSLGWWILTRRTMALTVRACSSWRTLERCFDSLPHLFLRNFLLRVARWRRCGLVQRPETEPEIEGSRRWDALRRFAGGGDDSSRKRERR